MPKTWKTICITETFRTVAYPLSNPWVSDLQIKIIFGMVNSPNLEAKIYISNILYLLTFVLIIGGVGPSWILLNSLY